MVSEGSQVKGKESVQGIAPVTPETSLFATK